VQADIRTLKHDDSASYRASGRLILTFGLGHVGATLIVAGGLAAAIRFGWVPISVARASDVGMSYGAVAVLGALTIAIPASRRPEWIGWWLAVALLAAFAGDAFTNAGHLVALIIGMSASVRFPVVALRFPVVARWTPVRGVLLGIGAAFGYLVLATELALPLAPIAGRHTSGVAAGYPRRLRRLRALPQPTHDDSGGCSGFTPADRLVAGRLPQPTVCAATRGSDVDISRHAESHTE
jgi:hypothetical protein